MPGPIAGIIVFEGLVNQIAAYVSGRIPCKMRSRLGTEDVLQEIARTILRTTLQRQSALSHEDWERMIWVVVRRQLRKQLKIASSPEDESVVQLNEHDHPTVRLEGLDTSFGLDELFGILKKCSERQRRIVHLRLEGLSNTEIARIEGVNEGSVRRQLLKVEQLHRGTMP